MHGSLALDGASLTPNAVALIARDGAPVEVSAEARARNDDARRAIAAMLERGEHLYGVTPGMGALRAHRVPKQDLTPTSATARYIPTSRWRGS